MTIAALTFAALTFARSDAAAQPVTLEYQQVLTRAVPGATAAFSLDPSRVGASAQDGLVTLVGRGPGSTNVVVITGGETVTLQVLVGEPPLVVLPGTRRGSAQSAGSGYYEARYGSDPGILQGNLLVSRREGERSAELALGGAAPLERDRSTAFGLPLASFTLRTPDREMTLLDRVVSNSPLTVSRSNVRGFHLRQGAWQAHAGYSFFSTFEHLLLPTNEEVVAGVGYRHRLDARSSLTPNLYYFDGPSLGDRRGPLATLFYETRPASDVTFSAELGVSRAVGGAVAFEIDRPNRRAWAKLRVAPSDLPSLTTDQQAGRQIEGGWIAHGDQSSLTATVSSRRYLAGAFDHTSHVASIDLRRHLTRHWAIHGGSGLSIFENSSQPGAGIHSVTLPVGASFASRHMGFGLDYQFARETTRDLGGHLVRATVNGTARGFRFTLFGERQTHAPTAGQILTDIPWLQPMLDRLGLAAATPQQLAELLRTNAELAAYGYANSLQLDLTPLRTRMGASGGWTGSGRMRPQLSVNTLFNRDGSVAGTARSAIHSLSYSQQLDRATEVFLTWSALCRQASFSPSSCQPVLSASLRRSLDNGPGLLMPRRGHIEGIVFRDDQGSGMYSPGLEPLAGVEVVLDSMRHTRTDSAGRFRFDGVELGRHRVEARYAADEPTYFTTPSPAEVETGGTVYFGVAPARSSLRGVVHTDAGIGLPGVLVHIAGVDRRTTARTADDGAFAVDGLGAGEYDVAIEPGSVPAGYPVDALAPQRVRVERSAPGRVTFVLRPYRSVAGRARLFDRATGQYVALAGARVQLQPLGRQAVTDASGQYAFRDLPPGEYRVVADHGGREHVATARVPDGPAFVREIDVAVLPASEVAAPGGPAEERRLASSSGQTREDASDAGRGARVLAAAGPFTIQVAESPSARHARAMVDELQSAGHAAYLVPEVSGPNGPYHVRVGQYSTFAEANRSAQTLEQALGWRMLVTASPAGPGPQAKKASYSR